MADLGSMMAFRSPTTLGRCPTPPRAGSTRTMRLSSGKTHALWKDPCPLEKHRVSQGKLGISGIGPPIDCMTNFVAIFCATALQFCFSSRPLPTASCSSEQVAFSCWFELVLGRIEPLVLVEGRWAPENRQTTHSAPDRHLEGN